MTKEQAVVYLRFSGFSEEQIKAIEGAFTCEDAISRKAVIDTLERMDKALDEDRTVENYKELLRECYKVLPPVNPQPKTDWIPVSERLPNVASVFRVTRYFPNNVMNPNYLVDACFFDGSNTWYNDNRINHERAYVNNVIAWQEDPEPYEPQESEDKA